jgi:hypothetical protein
MFFYSAVTELVLEMVTFKNHGIRIRNFKRTLVPLVYILVATLHSTEHIAINIIQAAQVISQ